MAISLAYPLVAKPWEKNCMCIAGGNWTCTCLVNKSCPSKITVLLPDPGAFKDVVDAITYSVQIL